MSTRSLLFAAALVSIPTVAAAQAADKPPDPRIGFFGGFGLYAGEISCDGPNCSGVRKAGGGEGHVGYAFSRKLGLIGDLWWMASSEDDVTITFINGSVGLRWWVAPIFWIQGGVGSGHASVRYAGIIDIEGTSDSIPTGFLSVGLELVQSKRFALDVALRIAQGSETEGEDTTGRMTGVGVGFTWF